MMETTTKKNKPKLKQNSISPLNRIRGKKIPRKDLKRRSFLVAMKMKTIPPAALLVGERERERERDGKKKEKKKLSKNGNSNESKQIYLFLGPFLPSF